MDTGRTEDAVPQLMYPTIAVKKYLFRKPLLNNGYCIFAYLAFVAQQRVRMQQYVKIYPMQSNIYSHLRTRQRSFRIQTLSLTEICAQRRFFLADILYVHKDISPPVAYFYTDIFLMDLRLHGYAFLMNTHKHLSTEDMCLQIYRHF
jgi:hypothetical protein